MGYWDCPSCAAENSLEAISCWRCGYHQFPGRQRNASPHESPQRDSLEKQRRSLQEEIRKSLEDALKRKKTVP